MLDTCLTGGILIGERHSRANNHSNNLALNHVAVVFLFQLNFILSLFWSKAIYDNEFLSVKFYSRLSLLWSQTMYDNEFESKQKNNYLEIKINRHIYTEQDTIVLWNFADYDKPFDMVGRA